MASRVAGVILLVLSGLACLPALAISPLGGGLRAELFDAQYAFCSPEWIELAQLFPPLLALAASGAAVVRAGRKPGLLLLPALALLVAWLLLSVAGECGVGSDDVG